MWSVHVVGDVDERRQDGVAIRRHPAEEQAQRALADARLHLLPRRQQVAKEALDVVVLLAERQPGDWEAARLGPLGEQRRLAIAGRGRDQDELVVGDAALESVDEPGAAHRVMRLWRNPQFGCQESGIHNTTPSLVAIGVNSTAQYEHCRGNR